MSVFLALTVAKDGSVVQLNMDRVTSIYKATGATATRIEMLTQGEFFEVKETPIEIWDARQKEQKRMAHEFAQALGHSAGIDELSRVIHARLR